MTASGRRVSDEIVVSAAQNARRVDELARAIAAAILSTNHLVCTSSPMGWAAIYTASAPAGSRCAPWSPK